MAIIKKRITSELLASKAKEFALRRINNRADRTVRLRLMETVVYTLCTDNIHLLNNPLNLHKLVWIPLRSGPQEDLSLLLNITSDILAWVISNGGSRTELASLMVSSYASIGPLVEYDPMLDPANHFVDNSVDSDELLKMISENIWYVAVMLLSTSDIRAEMIAAIEAMVKESGDGR